MTPTLITELDSFSTEHQQLVQAAKQELAEVLRRHPVAAGPAHGLAAAADAVFKRLAVTPDGRPWLRVEHPRQQKRQTGEEIGNEPPMQKSEDELRLMNDHGWSFDQVARRRFTASDPKWYGLAEGVALVLDPNGPTAELERRMREAAAEETAEMAALAKAAERLKQQRLEREAWGAAKQRWDALPRAEALRIALEAAHPEHAPFIRTMVRLFCAESIPMPAGWHPAE